MAKKSKDGILRWITLKRGDKVVRIPIRESKGKKPKTSWVRKGKGFNFVSSPVYKGAFKDVSTPYFDEDAGKFEGGIRYLDSVDGGEYIPNDPCSIDIGLKHKGTPYGESVLAHELGHYVWFDYVKGAVKAKFESLYKKGIKESSLKTETGEVLTFALDGYARRFLSQNKEVLGGSDWYSYAPDSKGDFVIVDVEVFNKFFVSQYAATNTREFFAESFMNYHDKDARSAMKEFSPELFELMEEVCEK